MKDIKQTIIEVGKKGLDSEFKDRVKKELVWWNISVRRGCLV